MVLISLHRPTKEQRQNIVRRGLKLADQFISPQKPVQRLGPNHAFSGATRKAPLLPNQLNSALWRILCRSVIVYLYKEDHVTKCLCIDWKRENGLQPSKGAFTNLGTLSPFLDICRNFCPHSTFPWLL